MTLLFFLRFFAFHLHESPRFLVGRGRDAEAVEVVHRVAEFNGRSSSLSLEMLRACEKLGQGEVEETEKEKRGAGKGADSKGVKASVMRKLRTFSGVHVKGLFATPKLAFSTTILIVIWGAYILRCCTPLTNDAL